MSKLLEFDKFNKFNFVPDVCVVDGIEIVRGISPTGNTFPLMPFDNHLSIYNDGVKKVSWDVPKFTDVKPAAGSEVTLVFAVYAEDWNGNQTFWTEDSVSLYKNAIWFDNLGYNSGNPNCLSMALNGIRYESAPNSINIQETTNIVIITRSNGDFKFFINGTDASDYRQNSNIPVWPNYPDMYLCSGSLGGFNGGVSLVTRQNKALTDTQALALSNDVFQLFRTPKSVVNDAIYASLFAGTPAPVIHSHTASGGVTTGGIADVIQIKNYLSSGGVVTGGSADISAVKTHQGSGGVITGGSAITEHISAGLNSYSHTATGGVTTGGIADVAQTKEHTATGGIVTGGSAIMNKKTWSAIDVSDIQMQLTDNEYSMKLSDKYVIEMELIA